MQCYEVAADAPIPRTLTYSQPADADKLLTAGSRVLVRLGQRLVTGYVLGQTAETPEHNIKPIAELLDPDPIFPAQLIPFFRWMADYYHYSLGKAISTALPAGTTARAGCEAALTEAGRLHLPAVAAAMDNPAEWMQTLLAKGKLPAAAVKTAAKQDAALLKSWQKQGWLELTETLAPPTAKAKTETLVRLRVPLAQQPAAALKPSEQKTLELLYQHCGGSPVMPRQTLTKLYAGAGKALLGLARAGLVSLEERQILRDPFGDALPYFGRPEQLTAEQDKAVSQLTAAVDAAQFQPFLLHGVTGSGKTEVYLRAAEHCLACNKNVLLLVPEIALASQVEAHFHSRFGSKIAVLHSGLSAGERFDQWQRILHGAAKIVIGARSGVFAPFAALGLVIVDEEHEPAYKQDEGLRYNGRDMAVLRARFAACPVLLGSATPSVTSFHHAQQGRYRLLTMTKRIDDQVMPEVAIVDLGKQKKVRPDWFFSEPLLAALQENLAKRQQSLLFVNRRGYASFMLCRDCGHIVQCRSCRVSLTWHRGSSRLICHYCGYSLPPELICPECRSGKLAGLGLGSERIEAEVRRLLPEARVVRLDSDTARSRRHYLAILRQVREQEADILVGTQMVAKGLHFPNMTLVGVVWADSGLGMPDYKAAERSFQLLAQVTGRAGRGEHPGKVIIQTHQPQHYVLSAARAHAYQTMYEQETELRQGLGYPPFGRLINVRFSGEKEERVAAAAQKTAELLRAGLRQREAEVLGPAPAPLSLIRNRYRWQLLLKGSQPELLHQLCSQLAAERQRLCGTDVRMGIDVDPENMM